MAIELPAPWFCRRRRAHHGQVIPALVVRGEVVVLQFTESVVQLPDVLCQCQAAGAEAGPHHPESRLALSVAHLTEADAARPIGTLVGPAAPLVGIVRKGRLLALLRRERGQEGLGRLPHRLGRDARGLEAEQTRLDLPVGGDALERHCQFLDFECARALLWTGLLRKRPRAKHRADHEGVGDQPSHGGKSTPRLAWSAAIRQHREAPPIPTNRWARRCFYVTA